MINILAMMLTVCCWLIVPALSTEAATHRVADVHSLQQIIDHISPQNPPVTITLQPGTYHLKNPLVLRAPIHIIGAGRDQVILDGGGMIDGVNSIFVIEADDVTIENLTMGNVRKHVVQIRGEMDVSRTTLRSVRVVDAYQQLVKVSANLQNLSAGSFDGLVEDSIFEYTAGIGPQWYIGGIDAHNAHRWVVRGNTFIHIRSPEGRLAEHAIHFWSESSDTLVENNHISYSDRGIGFGLGQSRHSGGIIRNNHVHTTRDVGIGLESAPGAQVTNNRVITKNYPNSIEYRFPTTTNVKISDNQVTGRIISRDGGSRDE